MVIMRPPRAVVALLLSLILAVYARLAAAQVTDKNTCIGGAGVGLSVKLLVPYGLNLLRAKHGVPPLQWNGGMTYDSDDGVETRLAAACAVKAAMDGGCKSVPAGDMPSTCRKPTCSRNGGDCPPVWSCPADAERCPVITWACKDCKGGPDQDSCALAVDQWTSYKWVDSDTPLDDNPKGLDYAQIVWAGATEVTCMQHKTGDCKAVACVFNKAIELTNEAFKANVKPLVAGASPATDKYSWCKYAKRLGMCKDEHLKCDDGTVADCCQTTCSEFVPPPDPVKVDTHDYPVCSAISIAIDQELCHRSLPGCDYPAADYCRTACRA